MEFDSESQKSEKMEVEGGGGSSKKKSSKTPHKALSQTEKEIEKQNAMIQNALKMGMNTHKLSQQANVELRGQRDQIVNVVNMVREIGLDLFKADKLANDINYRRLLNIVILYVLIFLLFISIILMIVYKF